MGDKLSLDFPPIRLRWLAPAQHTRTSTQFYLAKTTSHISPNSKKHFLYHAACMSSLVNLWVHQRNSINTTPPIDIVSGVRHSHVLLLKLSFYHSQGPDIGESRNHVLHRRQSDFRLQPTSSLSSLLFVSILSNATLLWPKGEKIHCHLFLSSTA